MQKSEFFPELPSSVNRSHILTFPAYAFISYGSEPKHEILKYTARKFLHEKSRDQLQIPQIFVIFLNSLRSLKKTGKKVSSHFYLMMC